MGSKSSKLIATCAVFGVGGYLLGLKVQRRYVEEAKVRRFLPHSRRFAALEDFPTLQIDYSICSRP